MFSFKTIKRGDQQLKVSAIGFKTHEQPVKLLSASLSVEITLKLEITELSAVVITAGTFEASDKKRAAAILDPIYIVSTASADGDITGALKTLPGSQLIGETEGLFIRGGTAAETKIFIDVTLVNNFFYSSVPNIAQRSRFSPFIFKGTVFSTCGYSALYGQALSSALILESVDLPERSAATLNITILNAGAGFQHLAKNKKSSWGIDYNYSDMSLAFALIKQRQDYSKIPVHHNLDANFRIKTSETGMLKYYGYFSTNWLAFTVPSINTPGYLNGFSLLNKNHYHNLSWKENHPKRWKIMTGISYSNNYDKIKFAVQDMNKKDVVLSGLEFMNFNLRNLNQFFNAKLVLEKNLKGLSAIRLGGEHNYSKDSIRYTALNGLTYSLRISENIRSVFTETDVYISDEIAVKAGARLEHSSLLNKMNLAPRTSLAYNLGKGSQVSWAYGIFYQSPDRRYLPSPYSLDFMRADHFIIQYQKVMNAQSLRLETFYKKYRNLIKTGMIGHNEVAINNNGFGEAKGFELFWIDKKMIKNLDYWISYSFLDTKRDFLNFPFAITPRFAANHTASLVTKNLYKNGKPV